MKLYTILLDAGPVIWPLLLCSVAVVTVIIERALFWYQLGRRRDRKLLDEVLTLAEQGQWEMIRRKTENSRDHLIRLIAVGILHRDYDMGKAMEAEAEQMIRRMSHSMPVLDTMITVAPLLGILGTVIGIISSFTALGADGLADPKLVTTGIGQALVTTAAGLSIAIFAVIPYNYFNTRISRVIHGMEKYGTSLEVVFARICRQGGRHED